MNAHRTQPTRREFLRLALASPVFLSEFAKSAIGADEASPAGHPHFANLNEWLTPFRRDNNLPALAAAMMKNGVVRASGAVGVRKAGDATTVTMLDKFHLGSCTKAMTATLAAMLVERQQIRWNSTLADIFPERAGKMLANYRKVTLEMLLRHRAGVPAQGGRYGPASASVIDQRLGFLDSKTQVQTEADPGTRFRYDNANYIIAGAMLERVSKQAWELLMQQRLFRPLGMTSAGFGPPSRPNLTDQPWGHVFAGEKFVPRYGDNPPALGPAGTVHCALLDYLKFADLHVSEGMRPPGILNAASCAKLHRPPPNENYAMGWITAAPHWAQGRALTHLGSNTMNNFVVWLVPQTGVCLAVATNASTFERDASGKWHGNQKVEQVLNQVTAELVQQFAEQAGF